MQSLKKNEKMTSCIDQKKKPAASILIVAPVEHTKLATGAEIPFRSCTHLMVIGKVAAEDDVPNANMKAGKQLYKYLYEFSRLARK